MTATSRTPTDDGAAHPAITASDAGDPGHADAPLVAPIDPFRVAADHAYRDELVVVRRVHGDRPRLRRDTTRTTHFDVTPRDGRLEVDHAVAPDELDDDLAGLLADELFAPGWVRGGELFERLFTGVVVTSGATPLDGWERFYRTTLDRLTGARRPRPGGAIAGYAPVHDRALELVAPGSVLELGCCFGFLSLRLARRGRAVTASDVSAGTVRLLDAVAPRLGAQVDTVVADAARYPAADDHADTVLAIHLLEHVDADHGDRILTEAVRLARRRVVIAVPYEHEADETFGHVRTVDADDLQRWGDRSGLPHAVSEHHGGWLVIDL